MGQGETCSPFRRPSEPLFLGWQNGEGHSHLAEFALTVRSEGS